jgi:hypothetical protein
MFRPAHSLALALVVAAATPLWAQGAGMRAELATPQEGTRNVVVDSRVWSCTGNACTASGNDPRPAIACRKLARKLGPVTRFAAGQGELDDAGLAICNQDHK